MFSVESLLTCKVFVLKYWTQVLLCCVLPVKTPFLISSVLSILLYDIFRLKAKYLWTLMLMILSHGWSVQKLSKYQVGIKWIMNEKLIWTPNTIYDASWRVLKSSGPHKFVEILEVLSVEKLMRAQLMWLLGIFHIYCIVTFSKGLVLLANNSVICPRPTVANVVCEPIWIGIRCASHSTVLIRITSY